MTIRTTPPISLSDVMAELRIANPGRTYPIGLGDADVRALAGRPSGVIGLGDLYGKSAYAPLAATAVGDSRITDSTEVAGTLNGYPTVNVTGGRGAKTYSWAVLNSSGSPTITGLNLRSPTVTKHYTKNTNGTATAEMQCTVTDETGASVISNLVLVTLTWDGNL